MLIKRVFDCKLNLRVQCSALHHSQTWILIGLSSSKIQLWDYRMKTILREFNGHDGAVCSVDFHPTQLVFVSAGEDCTLRLWSLETGQCIHKFKGHRGTVRTVFFHRTLPWIISASDDRYIMIWDWQSRRLIGYSDLHTGPVTCAKFHSKQDVVVSSSLDGTIRLWDLKLLKKKHCAPVLDAQGTGVPYPEGLMLEDKVWDADATGVNWVEFHPTARLILSGGNDCAMKLWRLDTENPTLESVFTGHTDGITSVCFYSRRGLLLSASKDGDVRIYDMVGGQLIERVSFADNEVSSVVVEQSLDVVVTVYDTGFSVFRLGHTEPCMTLVGERLYFINDARQLQHYDYKRNSASLPYLSLKKFISNWEEYTGISYNLSTHSVIVNKQEDGFLLLKLADIPTGAVIPETFLEGSGALATFISKTEFIVFNATSRFFEVRSLENSVLKSFSLRGNAIPTQVVPFVENIVIVAYPDCTILYDVAREKVIGETDVKHVKYIRPSPDYKYLALASDQRVTITDATLKILAIIEEKYRDVTGLAWDDKSETDHFLLYSAFRHLKYCLLNGENGVVRTLTRTAYLTRVTDHKAYMMNQDTNIEIIEINPDEYTFKQAVIDKDYSKVRHYIQNSTLVGQSIVSFLQQQNHPEIALKFTEDSKTRIDLLLESGDLGAALKEARDLQSDRQTWDRLLQYTLDCGNLEVAEECYQKLEDFDKLSFLYLITGNFEKIRLVSEIAKQRGDIPRLILNSLLAGGNEVKTRLFKELGSLPLAYLKAKSSGCEQMANKILTKARISGEGVVLPDKFEEISSSKNVGSPGVNVTATIWPLKPVKESSPSKLPKS